MVSPALSEGVNPPIKSSAQVKEPVRRRNLDALSEELARLGAAKDFNPPPPGGNSNPPEAGELPAVAGIQWERKKDGSVEAWHTPETLRRNRSGKTYLGRVGKRRMSQLAELAPEAAADELRRWVISKAMEKGISL